MTEQTFSYIARLSNPGSRGRQPGTIVCASSGDEDYKKETAKHIEKWIRDGLIIERVPDEFIRQNFGTANLYQP